MKFHKIVVSLIIPLALFSILSLLENVQAQTNSTIQIVPQQNQNMMNLTTQALMKVNIFELKDTLMKAKLALVDGNLDEAKTSVRDVESQFLEIEPMPTKFLDNIHRAIKAIAKSDIDKALNTLTQLQFTILKAENLIFKAAVANPQMMQQFDTMETNVNEDSKDRKVTFNEENSKDRKVTFNEENSKDRKDK